MTGRWGRDVREPDLTMVGAPVPGGLEPRPLPATAEEIRAFVARLVSAYVPEWTDRSPDDAGLALLRVHATMAAAVTQRLNRMPRRLALAQVELAGVRPRPASTADAVLGLVVAEGSPPVPVPEGTLFVTPAGSAGPSLETTHGCTALPGRVSAVAVVSDGLVVRDDAADLAGLRPFGARRRPPAQLWLALSGGTEPSGLLTLAVRLAPRPGRPTAESAQLEGEERPPGLAWEAVTPTGPVELAVQSDGTRGLTRDGILVLRADLPLAWLPTTLPGRQGDPPAHWLRARLTGSTFPAGPALATVTLNGVAASARRTVRDEVAEPVDRHATGRSRYRLSQVPVLPGSVVLDVAETASGTDPFGLAGETGAAWEEVPSLAPADPGERSFTLDPTTGILTFGDGVNGRAVPPGYRNVVARSYATGGPAGGLPRPEDVVSSERSIPGLTGATVLSITTVSGAETPRELLVRGPATVRSRRRAVAPADYATLALETPGAGVARAHCLPAERVPGIVTVLVLPAAPGQDQSRTPPTATPETLTAVARHLSGVAGVAGARVVATTPRFRSVAVTALLVGGADADLARLSSDVRARIDAWLHPLTGGDGTGWPFGGTVRWDALSRTLLADVPDLLALSRLSFRVDGRRTDPCVDVPLASDELVRPGTHALSTIREGRS